MLHSNTHPLPAYRNVNFSWAFVLQDGGCDSRLIVRARVAYTPVWPAPFVRVLMLIGFGIGDVLQAGGLLGGIKHRAESAAENVGPRDRRGDAWQSQAMVPSAGGPLSLALLAAPARGVARLRSSIAIGGGITAILGGSLSVGASDLSGGDVRLGVGEAVANGCLHVALRRRIIALIRPAIALLRHRSRVYADRAGPRRWSESASG